MKGFRQYLAESTSPEEFKDLKDEINLLPKSAITRSTSKGYYVSVDCKRDYDGTYEVSDRMATELNGLNSSWNRRHSNKIDWEMPDEKKDEVYIYFK